jgi:uncharacterized membrane protein (GlpM family)
VVMFTRIPKHRPGAWFVPLRGSFLPVTRQGWLLCLPYLLFLVAVFLWIDRNSHSVSDTLYGVVPYWVACIILMHVIAWKKS